uniref:Uncharacterized protein n=1 Tax=Anguilla anguilla TaxID=7936 RepID=A0A0E9VTY1_ANGAN
MCECVHGMMCMVTLDRPNNYVPMAALLKKQDRYLLCSCKNLSRGKKGLMCHSSCQKNIMNSSGSAFFRFPMVLW